MKVSATAVLITALMTGCASQDVYSKVDSPAPSVTPRAQRVTLPYRFWRGGVEIKVGSIEPLPKQVQVNLSLQETRSAPATIIASTLMKVVSSGGVELPYLHYIRNGQVYADPKISLTSGERGPWMLIFEQPRGLEDQALELRFPTGKYWASRIAE